VNRENDCKEIVCNLPERQTRVFEQWLEIFRQHFIFFLIVITERVIARLIRARYVVRVLRYVAPLLPINTFQKSDVENCEKISSRIYVFEQPLEICGISQPK